MNLQQEELSAIWKKEIEAYRRFGLNKLVEDAAIIKQAEKEIEICGEKARKIREERQIEPSSETQTPKR